MTNDERPSLTIRRATGELAERLTEIARASKAYWGYPPEWLDAWRDELLVREAAIDNGYCYAGWIDNDIVGFYLLEGSGPRRTLEHLWLHPSHIGQGFGSSLLGHALATAGADGAREVEIMADPNAQGFYERHGAKQIGESVGEVVGQKRVLPVLLIELPASSP